MRDPRVNHALHLDHANCPQNPHIGYARYVARGRKLMLHLLGNCADLMMPVTLFQLVEAGDGRAVMIGAISRTMARATRLAV